MFLKESVDLVCHGGRILADYNAAVTDDELKGLFNAIRDENAVAHAETRKHFDASVERVENRFDVIAERMEGRIELLAETVQLVNENLQTKIVALDQKLDKTTGETQGLVKFLYDDLSRRVVVIEGKLSPRT
jgi:tellurite resistance protein